ncbi:MAG: glycosyltransferase [Phycisphaerae bacterium]|nr:glycosyltransferase [Phycisphaerae bacterium]
MTDTATPARPKRLLLLTTSVGAGHNSVARAIHEGLMAAGGLDVTVVDSMKIVPAWFRTAYAGGFMLTMSRLPRVYGLMYVMANRPQTPARGLWELARLRLERYVTRHLRPLLLSEHFDLIVHTHYLVPSAIAWLRHRGLIDTPQFVMVTDIETHRLWFCPDVDHWFLPTPYTAQAFRRWGVDETRMTVSGIALQAKWTAPVERRRVYADWDLPSDSPIVLLSGGTEFVCGPVVKLAHGICRACPRATVVVLAGRNKKLRAELAAWPEPTGRVRAIPFTDRGHELAEVSSLMVTKPGGVTTAECLARGTPMVLTDPISGHEGGNAQYLTCNEAAVIARGERDIIATVACLLDHPDLLRQMSDNARRLYRPGREIITDAILRALGLPGASTGGAGRRA